MNGMHGTLLPWSPFALLEDHLLFLAQALNNFGARTVSDSHLDVDSGSSRRSPWSRYVNTGVPLCIVDYGTLGDDERILVLLEQDLGIRSHIGL